MWKAHHINRIKSRFGVCLCSRGLLCSGLLRRVWCWRPGEAAQVAVSPPVPSGLCFLSILNIRGGFGSHVTGPVGAGRFWVRCRTESPIQATVPPSDRPVGPGIVNIYHFSLFRLLRNRPKRDCSWFLRQLVSGAASSKIILFKYFDSIRKTKPIKKVTLPFSLWQMPSPFFHSSLQFLVKMKLLCIIIGS